MGLTPFDENAHPKDQFFTSQVDGRKYLKIVAKPKYRFSYVLDILRNNVLRFGDKEESYGRERMPPELGYLVNFNDVVVKFKNNDVSSIETYAELFKNWQKYGCYSLATFYVDTIKDVFKDIKFDIISGPPRGGVSFEVAIDMQLKQNTRCYHIVSDGLAQKIYREDTPPLILFENDKVSVQDCKSVLIKRGKVLMCDDCLLTGNSIRKEAKALQEKTKLKDVELCGIIVGLDCGFYGKSGKRVSEELEDELGVKVESIADIEEAIDAFRGEALPILHYPVKPLEGWATNIDTITAPGYVEECNRQLVQFDEEVYEPFAKFMKTQREAISLEETIKRLRA